MKIESTLVKYSLSLAVLIGGCFLYWLLADLRLAVGGTISPLVLLLVFISILPANGKFTIVASVFIIIFVYFFIGQTPTRLAINAIVFLGIAYVLGVHRHSLTEKARMVDELRKYRSRADLRRILNSLEKSSGDLKGVAAEIYSLPGQERNSKLLLHISSNIVDVVTVGDGLLQIAEEREKAYQK